MPRSPAIREQSPGWRGGARRPPPLSWWLVFFPWLRLLRQGRIVSAACCLFLQLTLYGWPAAVLWARLVGPGRSGSGIPIGDEPFSPPRFRADMWGAPPGIRRDI